MSIYVSIRIYIFILQFCQRGTTQCITVHSVERGLSVLGHY